MIVRPDARFLFSHPAHAVALGFGAGLAPVAPGTVGTLLGWPIFWAITWLDPAYRDAWLLCIALVLFCVGIWACARTGRDLGIPDHSGMVWDEVVAFLLILTLIPPGWAWQVGAFFLFRVFDVLKPPPIRQVDRTWKGGFGVMADDIIAAFYTLLVIAIVKRLLGL
jgi:phosphatidylglycerophosphatase A